MPALDPSRPALRRPRRTSNTAHANQNGLRGIDQRGIRYRPVIEPSSKDGGDWGISGGNCGARPWADGGRLNRGLLESGEPAAPAWSAGAEGSMRSSWWAVDFTGRDWKNALAMAKDAVPQRCEGDGCRCASWPHRQAVVSGFLMASTEFAQALRSRQPSAREALAGDERARPSTARVERRFRGPGFLQEAVVGPAGPRRAGRGWVGRPDPLTTFIGGSVRHL